MALSRHELMLRRMDRDVKRLEVGQSAVVVAQESLEERIKRLEAKFAQRDALLET
jgi:hypothetical protein